VGDIPTGLRVFFNGTNAAIPTGWSEDTDFSARYLQDNTVAGTNGGGATHTHAVNSHIHTTAGHTHTMSHLGTGVGGFLTDISTKIRAHILSHTHINVLSETGFDVLNSTTPSINAFNAEPPFHELILIKPDTGDETLPDKVIVFGDRDLSLDAGVGDYFLADGSTPDLDDRFLKTVAGGGDAGTTGGSATHGGSDHGTFSHNHSSSGHIHPDSDLGAVNQSPHIHSGGKGGTTYELSQHHIAISWSTETPGTSTNNVSLSTDANLPLYHRFAPFEVQNGAGLRDDAIFPFVGLPSEIPSGWQLVGINDRQINCTTTIGEIGDEAGSNTHTHTGNHGHTGLLHFHTASVANSPINISALIVVLIGVLITNKVHTHGVVSIFASQDIINNTNVTMSSDDHRFNFRTVLFIKRTPVKLHILGLIQINGGELAAI